MYATVEDLRLGNIPLPTGDKPERSIAAAAREMDSWIGQRYVTPVFPTGKYQHPIKSLLRTINSWLATGRLIEELTASSQTVEIHAYANKLIAEAIATLQAIARGDIVLHGCELIGEGDEGSEVTVGTGPIIINVDDSSPTQYHYDEITNPLFTVQNREAMERLAPSIYGYVYVDGGGPL